MVKAKLPSVNLIPVSHRLPSAYSLDKMMMAGTAIVLCLCLTVYALNYRRIWLLEAELESLRVRQVSQSQQIDILKAKLEADASKSEQQNLVQQIIGKKLPWSDIFKELTMVIPKQTWLTEMNAKSNLGQVALYMKGETISQAYMADFYSALEKSEYFNKVLMLSSKISESSQPPTFQFEFASPGMAQDLKPLAGP